MPLEVLVDTGSDLTWLPGHLLRDIGVTPRRKRTFAKGANQFVEREVGYAILRANGYETADEVVFAEPEDLPVLGVRTLEGFGITMDAITHRFLDITIFAAFCRHNLPKAA
jgi:predicted aspartyl protease